MTRCRYSRRWWCSTVSRVVVWGVVCAGVCWGDVVRRSKSTSAWWLMERRRRLLITRLLITAGRWLPTGATTHCAHYCRCIFKSTQFFLITAADFFHNCCVVFKNNYKVLMKRFFIPANCTCDVFLRERCPVLWQRRPSICPSVTIYENADCDPVKTKGSRNLYCQFSERLYYQNWHLWKLSKSSKGVNSIALAKFSSSAHPSAVLL